MFFFVLGSCEFCLVSSFPVAVASIGFICCCAFPCSRELPGICESNAWDIILFRSLEQFVPLLGNVFFRARFAWTSSSLLKMAQNHQRCFRATAMGRRYGCSFIFFNREGGIAGAPRQKLSVGGPRAKDDERACVFGPQWR
jgi:hypothetical protein